MRLNGVEALVVQQRVAVAGGGGVLRQHRATGQSINSTEWRVDERDRPYGLAAAGQAQLHKLQRKLQSSTHPLVHCSHILDRRLHDVGAPPQHRDKQLKQLCGLSAAQEGGRDQH